MEEYLKQFEFSTRTEGFLNMLGVDSDTALLNITKAQFLRIDGAGRKSWDEVQEAQQELIRQARLNSAEGRALALVRQLNLHMRSIKQQGYYLATNSETREVVLCKQIKDPSE